MTQTLISAPFPFKEIAAKVALATGIGLLVGLEREWAQKEIGVRTFAITGLLGLLTSLLDPTLVLGALMGVLVLVVLLNVHSLLKDRSLELTTSGCLIVTFFLGAMVGLGHPFTAATSAIVMMLLLSWKVELEKFAGALRPEEIRSAVLLGLLSVVIYPLLPDRTVDPWRLVNPRQAWVIVVVIAGIGFVNYVLLRLYSTRGLYYSALLGGLVNSTAAVAELAGLFAASVAVPGVAIAAFLLTDVAMFMRNLVILAIFAPRAALTVLLPLGMMCASAGAFAWISRGRENASGSLRLSSPISLRRVLKFAALFLALEVAGSLAQRHLGNLGFLVVSFLGGLVSSASTAASAAALAATHKISPQTAGAATVLTSVASALINLPLVYQQIKDRQLAKRLTLVSLAIVAVGVGALIAIETLRVWR